LPARKGRAEARPYIFVPHCHIREDCFRGVPRTLRV
jgi:hypothetical protein